MFDEILACLDGSPLAQKILPLPHGRTAWAEAIVGSVALRVIQGSSRPVILYRAFSGDGETPKRISTLVLALDGSEFAERMIPIAAEMAQALAARLGVGQA